MRALFTLTLFLGSFLLFLVQPIAAKMLLPSFGGAPQVWITSMLFFQAGLLLGYLYAHLAIRRLGARRQAMLHVVLLALALLALPIAAPLAGVSGEKHAALGVLASLFLMVGASFFVVSAGAPLVQAWFATSKHPDAADPYFLYSASNLGSMAALLCYPFLLEPTLTLRGQALAWTAGYVMLALLMGSCALFIRGWGGPSTEGALVADSIGWPRRFRWICLAAAPSSLLLGVTAYLTTNLTPMPLLWVAPLALYLATFILAFSRKVRVPAKGAGRALALLALPLSIALVLEASEPLVLLALLHLSVLAAAGLACHGALAEDRPTASHLTEFYLWISVGGVFGGIFNGLVAPIAFNTLAEYPIALVVACMLIPSATAKGKKPWDWLYPSLVGATTLVAVLAVRRLDIAPSPATTLIVIGVPVLLSFFAIDRPVRFALSLGAVFLVSNLVGVGVQGRILLAERSFFGVSRVQETPDGITRTLTHGNTVHGRQRSDMPAEPLTYYHRATGIGRIMASPSAGDLRRSVGLVGLGVGTLAAYGTKGDSFTFFEIDPVVVRLATDQSLFTYLSSSMAKVRIVLGDGRLSLAQAPDHSFGILVLDAFSSDAIPIHLLTKEALAMYERKLVPGGIMLFHVSNRYLALGRPLAGTAGSLGLSTWSHTVTPSAEDLELGKNAATWVAIARSRPAALAAPEWEALSVHPGARPWTDDYSNILGAFKRDSDEPGEE